MYLKLGVGFLLVSLTMSRIANGASSSGGAFLNMPLSVRQMGMGNVSAPGDVLGAWSNPALLGSQDMQGKLALSGSSLFKGEQTSFGMGGAWLASPNWAIGGFVSGFSAGIPEVDELGDETGATLGRSMTIIAATTSFALQDWLVPGITMKSVSDKVAGNGTSVIAADVGVSIHWEGIYGGASLRNIGPDLRNDAVSSGGGESLPRETRVGFGYLFKTYNIRFGGEYLASMNRESDLDIGAEWWPAAFFAVRAGVSGQTEAQRELSFGLSGVYRRIGIDYAFSTHPLGAISRVSLSLAFGETRAALERETVPVPSNAPPGPVPAAVQHVGGTSTPEQTSPESPATHPALSRSSTGSGSSQSENIEDELQKVRDLKSKGLISDQDAEEMRKKILKAHGLL